MVTDLDTAFEIIEGFNTLSDDWDSYGAVPPSVIVIDNAKTLIEEISDGNIRMPNSIYPDPNSIISPDLSSFIVFDWTDCSDEPYPNSVNLSVVESGFFVLVDIDEVLTLEASYTVNDNEVAIADIREYVDILDSNSELLLTNKTT